MCQRWHEDGKDKKEGAPQHGLLRPRHGFSSGFWSGLACWFVHGRICKQARRRRLVLLLAKKGKRACEAPATTAQCVAHKEKGGVKKGRISHPASKNQNKQANKERTKQKQGAKAGQVTEKRGEKKEEREAHFILPPLTHSHAASAASAATASVPWHWR